MSGEMMVVGVIGQKGGGGKTTTSLGLAVAAAEEGKASVVIDIDQQANSAKWRDRRQMDNVAVIGTLQSRIKQTLETARTTERITSSSIPPAITTAPPWKPSAPPTSSSFRSKPRCFILRPCRRCVT